MGWHRGVGVIVRLVLVVAGSLAVFLLRADDSDTPVILVLIAVVAILIPVLLGVRSQLATVTRLDAHLREEGRPGTAIVMAAIPTAFRIGAEKVFTIELQIDAGQGDPYRATIRQRVPAFWGPLDPGSPVGVRIDPHDPQRLAIDWDVPMPITPPEPEPPVADTSQDVDDLAQRGRRARAVIISLEPADEMIELGVVEVGSPDDDGALHVIDMEVQQAGLDPYEVRVAQRVPTRLVGRIGPRTRVTVGVDRDDESVVAIDWTSLAR